MKKLSGFCLVLLLLIPLTLRAEEIEEVLPNGLLAQARYHQGNADKPVILLLHGFLTVHTFNLINNIADELANNQYSVLAPTLTLGISRRKSTLDCRALHLHNMETDSKEIEWWVNWLIGKGHKNIILAGHSSGAVQVIDYGSTQKHKEVSKVVALSLIPLADKNNSHFMTASKKARKMLGNRDEDIENFTLAYCIENYTAPAREFMSYAQWDADRILKALQGIKVNKAIIMGSEDIPVYKNWIDDMQKSGARIMVINGADHFFGSNTEFELYDTLLQELANK